MVRKKTLSKKQLNALARGRAIRKQNIKNLTNQTGGAWFDEHMETFWEKADLQNPKSMFQPGAGFGGDGWDKMMMLLKINAPLQLFNIDGTRPMQQPWGFIIASYTFLTKGAAIIAMPQPDEAAAVLDKASKEMVRAIQRERDAVHGPAHLRANHARLVQEARQELRKIENTYINMYLNREEEDQEASLGHRVGTWASRREDSRLLYFFSKYLSIPEDKIKSFLFLTIREILDQRFIHLDTPNVNHSLNRVQEMPMFLDLLDDDTHLGDKISRSWTAGLARAIALTHWVPLTAGETGQFNDFVGMFKNIWDRLIVPAMAQVVEDSRDPYEEFGITYANAVPTPEPPYDGTPNEEAERRGGFGRFAAAAASSAGGAAAQSGGRRKRSVTKKQLEALAKGRAIRMRNIRNNKRGGY